MELEIGEKYFVQIESDKHLLKTGDEIRVDSERDDQDEEETIYVVYRVDGLRQEVLAEEISNK